MALHTSIRNIKISRKIMQSMNTNCYDRTIAALQEYRNLESMEHNNTVLRAIVKLKQNKIMASVEENLVSNAPMILQKLMESNGEKGEIMKIITEEMFSVVKTQEDQSFVKMDNNLFSLNAETGVYFFSMKYDESESAVTVYRKQSNDERRHDIYGFIFKHFPQLNVESQTNDLKIVEKILIKLFKRLSRSWKYLTLPKTPSSVSSATTQSLSVEEELEIGLQFVNEAI